MFRPGWLEALKREAAERDGAETEPVVWCPHEPHAKQAAFLAETGLEVGFGGAAGGGKSDALLMAALEHVDKPGYDAIIFRKTFQDLKLAGALIDRSHDWLAGTPAKWNGSDHVWTFPSGAKLAFGYMDNPRDHLRYKSSEFAYIGIDQAEQFPLNQYLYLFSRLRSTVEGIPLRMRLSMNPGDIGHDWLKDRFGIPDEPDFSRIYTNEVIDQNKNIHHVTFVPSLVDDNPSMPAEYVNNLALLDAVTHDQLRKGKWVRDPSGLVYSGFRKEKSAVNRLPELPNDEQWTRILGMDFGVSNQTAFVELAFTEHWPTVYVTRSEQWTEQAPSDTSDKMKKWETDAGEYEACVGDIGGLGKGYQAEWSKRYHWMRAAQKQDKRGNIRLINGDFHHAKLQILPGNEELVDTLVNLMWKDEQQLTEYPGQPNHLTDALLYGWREARHWAWERREEEQPTPEQRARYDAEFRKQRKRDKIRRAAEEDETGLPSGWSSNEEYGIDGD